MSVWEGACWSWYAENVTPFTIDTGILAEMFKDLKLDARIKFMFVSAMSAIHNCIEFVKADRHRKAQEAKNNG